MMPPVPKRSPFFKSLLLLARSASELQFLTAFITEGEGALLEKDLSFFLKYRLSVFLHFTKFYFNLRTVSEIMKLIYFRSQPQTQKTYRRIYLSE